MFKSKCLKGPSTCDVLCPAPPPPWSSWARLKEIPLQCTVSALLTFFLALMERAGKAYFSFVELQN